jgi:hypothetical protein
MATATVEEMPCLATCDRCGGSRAAKPGKDNIRLPRGWHRHRDALWCEPCWKSAFTLRSATFAVAGPADGTWEEFRAALKECWQASTQLANWAVMTLARRDVTRRPGMDKLPPMPKVELYRLARPDGMEVGDAQSRSCLFRAVEAKYRAARYEVVWRCERALPTFRYPVPYPVHNQSWEARLGDDGEALVNLRLGGRRWTLRLRGGAEFRRQFGQHRQLVKGEALAGELAVYQVETTDSAHRPGVASREPGGGRRAVSRVMVKLVGWFPKREARESEGTLFVRTGPDSLLSYRVDDGDEVAYRHQNSDHLRRWVAEHRRKLDRLNEDRKREKRVSKRTRMRMTEAGEAWSRKYNDRLDSHCHEVSAAIAAFAERRRVARVVLDDTDKSYVASFPWAKLRLYLKYKLDERRIAVEFIPPEANRKAKGQKVTPETAED